MISSKRFVVTLLAAGVLALVWASTSSSHIAFRNFKEWAFGSYTLKPDKSAHVDPITVVFAGGGTLYGNDEIKADLRRDWGYPAPMSDSGACGAGDQGLRFNDRQGHEAAYDDTEDIDYHAEQVRGCGLQHHIRLWDDFEHETVFPSHDLNSWSVGTIHYEKRQGPGGSEGFFGHKRLESFEKTSRHLRDEYVFEHCTFPKWRYLPGSEGKKGDRRYTDGYLVRIDLSKGKRSPNLYRGDCNAQSHLTR